MSGHKVVGVLDAFNEAYIYGNTVYRRKQSVLNGSKRANYSIVPSAAAANAASASSSSASPSNAAAAGAKSNSSGPLTVVDLVLSHRGAFKLKSRIVPPKNGGGGGTSAKKKEGAGAKKFGRGAAAAAQQHADPNNNGEDDDDEDYDPLDADAMMQAAMNGEDIQKLYNQLRTQREARRKVREAANGGGSSALTSSSSASSSSKPDVIWRQEHCYVKAVTPLLSLTAEDEEERYRRAEEEAEEERLREEEAEAKAVLEHALGNAAGAKNAVTGSPVSIRKAANNKYENADIAAAAEDEKKNKMTREMLKRREKSASELACDPNIGDDQCYGFVVHYFAIGKRDKTPAEETAIGGKFSRHVKNALLPTTNPPFDAPLLAVLASSSSLSSQPPIRYRTYVCSSRYEQEEWLMVYRNTLVNYWHGRLEDSLIMAPEIFQFQTFAFDVSAVNYSNVTLPGVGGNMTADGDVLGPFSSPSVPKSAYSSATFFSKPSFPAVGGVLHTVLSTAALYVVPRSSKAEFENDDTVTYIRMPVEALQHVAVSKSKGVIVLVGGVFTPKAPLKIAFYSPQECFEFIMELQRVWELCSVAAASVDSAFPYRMDA